MLEAAASLFLSVLLFSGVQLLATLGVPFMLFAGAPLAVLSVRRGKIVLFGTILTGVVLVSALSGPGAGVAFVLVAGMPALLTGRALSNNWRPETVVGLVAVIIASVTLVVLEGTTEGGLKSVIEQVVNDSVAVFEERATPEEAAVWKEGAAFYIEWAYRLSPMTFIWSGMLVGVAVLLSARGYFRRNPVAGITLTPINRWHLPDIWVWTVVAAGALLAVPESGVLHTVGFNALGVLALVYALQGWAVVSHFFERRQVHGAVRAAFYLVPVFFPVLVLALTVMGLIDVWADFRKVRAGGPPEAAGRA